MDKWMSCYLAFGYPKLKFTIDNKTPGFGMGISGRLGLGKIGAGKILMFLGSSWKEWSLAVFLVENKISFREPGPWAAVLAPLVLWSLKRKIDHERVTCKKGLRLNVPRLRNSAGFRNISGPLISDCTTQAGCTCRLNTTLRRIEQRVSRCLASISTLRRWHLYDMPQSMPNSAILVYDQHKFNCIRGYVQKYHANNSLFA